MKKVLVGCAVATGLVLLIVVGAGFYLYRTFQSAMGDQEANKAVAAQLEERDGPVEQQMLPLDGVPSAEEVQAYLQISRTLSARFDGGGSQLLDFLVRMNAKQNPLRRAVKGVRGSIDLTRSISSLNASVDSLLLETGISEGRLAYVYALHRYGIMGWQPPSLEAADPDSTLSRKAHREANEAIEGVELEIENGIAELLRRQREAIATATATERTPALEECQMWLDRLLEARSLFDALRHEGALENQRRAFAAVDAELIALVPTTLGGYFLEMLTLGVDREGDKSFNFNYSTDE